MLHFQPKRGEIFWCDFSGYKIPEIVKTRPVLVIKKHKHNPKLVYVVPGSNLEPEEVKIYHYALDKEFTIEYFNDKEHWVKIDMVYTISIERLDRVKNKIGIWTIPKVSNETLQKILEKFEIYYGNKQQNRLAPVN